MEIIKLKIDEVIPYENNPRNNDEAVAYVAESIKQCGYCSPIIIDEYNVILCGHTRLKALKQLGYKEVECVRKSGMTDEQKKKYRILDNKTAEVAEWNFDLLEEELKDLDFGDFDFGFDDIPELSEPAEITEDEVPEVDDKIADRIAGAIVDLAYTKENNPKIAVEVLIGHGKCVIIAESSVHIECAEVVAAVARIAGKIAVYYEEVKQDEHLADNQKNGVRCGDNGIFKGVPISAEEKRLSKIARAIYERYPYDGKYILDVENGKLIICQSNANKYDLLEDYAGAIVNPLGDWTGGTDVDTGATNRKLGSDMAQSVTGGGLHGKDLSKADVSVNIYAFQKAQKTGKPVELCCAIGDNTVDGKPYSEIVEEAREYIKSVGGFEKFAEWGLF